jgi:hypothetical protein
MKKIAILFIISVLLCTVPLSGVLAKKKPDPKTLGWGLAFGALYFPQPKFKYESTSIGDINFSCDIYGTTASFFLLGKTNLYGWRPLTQAEFGLGWVHGYGHKNMTLQGYPAIAESDIKQIGAGFSFMLDYLKIGKVRLGSGFEVYGGWTREHFNVSLLRDDQRIDVFDPKDRTRGGATGGFILLSARMIDNIWNSWDIRFGYGGIDLSRNNDYDRHSLEDFSASTSVRGWYFHIRKLIPFELRKEPLPERE